VDAFWIKPVELADVTALLEGATARPAALAPSPSPGDVPGGACAGSVWTGRPAALPAVSAAAPPRPRILVADDEPINRQVASGLLDRLGFDCLGVADGLAAVRAVRDGEFVAVLMDMRMPGMGGLEAATEIRRIPGRRGRVPVFAVSADSSREDVAAQRLVGMDAGVSKPISRAALATALARHGLIDQGSPHPASPGSTVPAPAPPEVVLGANRPAPPPPAVLREAVLATAQEALGEAAVGLAVRSALGVAASLVERANRGLAGTAIERAASDAARLATLCGDLGAEAAASLFAAWGLDLRTEAAGPGSAAYPEDYIPKGGGHRFPCNRPSLEEAASALAQAFAATNVSDGVEGGGDACLDCR